MFSGSWEQIKWTCKLKGWEKFPTIGNRSLGSFDKNVNLTPCLHVMDELTRHLRRGVLIDSDNDDVGIEVVPGGQDDAEEGGQEPALGGLGRPRELSVEVPWGPIQ